MKKIINKLILQLCLIVALITCSPLFTSAAIQSQAKLIVLFVVDGLRPDLVSAENTPNIFRLAEEGVRFENSHAVFPTVTRVNSAAIATGAYPIVNGIVSNSMYAPEVDASRAFSTGDYENLITLDERTDGQLLCCKSWAQRLAENGLVPVALGSGSTGSTFLLNHRAPQGVGLLINGYFEPGRILAYPEAVNRDVLDMFGPAPSLEGAPNYNVKVDWMTQVLNDYVLTKVKPDVIYCWLTEPDHTQHGAGIGAPKTLATIRNSDRNIGLFLKKLKALGLYDAADVFIVSDHGFGTYNFNVNVAQALIDAGLKESVQSDDVVLASSGQSVLIHVKNRDKEKVARIAHFLRTQEWCGVLFTAGNGRPPEQYQGFVDGTFSLELLHQPGSGRGADIILTFPWTSQKNKYGYPGMEYSNSSRPTGPRSGVGAGHGSMSPWTIRNTMIAWGVDFKSAIRNRVPACSIDVTATILALKNIPLDDHVQGRILYEALAGGPDHEKIIAETVVYERDNVFIQISKTGKQWYVDKSWRLEQD